jgi:hypothetical protein
MEEDLESSRTFSTLRRLSSLSKKHGRRISGGWKFGTGSSTSTNSSSEGRVKLETVVGSPVKQARVVADELSPDAAAGPEEDGESRDIETGGLGLEAHGGPDKPDRYVRGGSVSAPNSILKPPTQSARDLNAEWDKLASGTAPAGLPLNSASTQAIRLGGSSKADKERRRQSWNDFVIPKNVLEKQKEVRRGIEGVKRFAGGVESELPSPRCCD